MRSSLTSELTKLRRRGIVAALGLIVVLISFGTVLSIVTATTSGSSGRGPGGGLSLSALANADGLARAISGGSAIVGAAILAVACFSFASEYSLGTLRNLLVRQPRRLTLFAGKLAATLLVLASAVIVGVLIASIAGVVAADARSSSTSAWFGASGVSALLKATAELAGASLGWATLGAALGVTLRSPTIAIASGLAYVLPVENLLTAAWSSGREWLPGQLLSALADGGTSRVSGGHAAVLLSAYMALALIGSALLIRLRDVGA